MTDHDAINEEVEEFLEVCKYNNRTVDENLAILLEDNPEDKEHFKLIASLARTVYFK